VSLASSERGQRLIEQLELAIEDLEETQAVAEAKPWGYALCPTQIRKLGVTSAGPIWSLCDRATHCLIPLRRYAALPHSWPIPIGGGASSQPRRRP
jgi:hypothetical protein